MKRFLSILVCLGTISAALLIFSSVEAIHQRIALERFWAHLDAKQRQEIREEADWQLYQCDSLITECPNGFRTPEYAPYDNDDFTNAIPDDPVWPWQPKHPTF